MKITFSWPLSPHAARHHDASSSLRRRKRILLALALLMFAGLVWLSVKSVSSQRSLGDSHTAYIGPRPGPLCQEWSTTIVLWLNDAHPKTLGLDASIYAIAVAWPESVIGFCLDQLEISEQMGSGISMQMLDFLQLCSPPSPDCFHEFSEADLSSAAHSPSPLTLFLESHDPFLFPFDYCSLNAVLTVHGHAAAVLPPGIAPTLRGPVATIVWWKLDRWQVSSVVAERPRGLPADAPPAVDLRITLRRLLPQRVATIVVLASLVAMIAALIFVEDRGSFIEGAVGILLGLWGLQGILVPSYIEGPTIIHSATLILYLLLAFAVFVRFVVRPAWEHPKAAPTRTVADAEPLAVPNKPSHDADTTPPPESHDQEGTP